MKDYIRKMTKTLLAFTLAMALIIGFEVFIAVLIFAWDGRTVTVTMDKVGVTVAAEADIPEPITNERIVTPRVIADEQPQARLISLGEFKLYHYCPCTKCCGEDAQGITFTETIATAGRTISVDPDVIPLGTTVIIGGRVYIAEDIGKGIKGKTIDIFMDSHEEARAAGVQYAEVFVNDTKRS